MAFHFRSSYATRIRVFEQGSFKYDYDERIGKHMAIYLLIVMDMEKLGYNLYTSGNISGRYDLDGETKVVSPHTWFFAKWNIPRRSPSPPTERRDFPPSAPVVQLPPSPTPSAPPGYSGFDSGLPTYEEACKLADEESALQEQETANDSS